FAASLCLNVQDPAFPGCEPGTLGRVHAGGRGAAAIAAAAAVIHFPLSAADVCTAEAPVRVRLGRRPRRRVVLHARARDLASRQCSTGPGSNPHDVAVVGPHKAYVTRFDRPELWIVDPDASSCAGFFLGQVDLGSFADADGLPEMDQMTLVADRLFVSLERLDRRRGFAPAGKSLLVVIDTATDAVVGTVELSGGNAFGETAGLMHEPGTGKLVVADAGNI